MGTFSGCPFTFLDTNAAGQEHRSRAIIHSSYVEGSIVQETHRLDCFYPTSLGISPLLHDAFGCHVLVNCLNGVGRKQLLQAQFPVRLRRIFREQTSDTARSHTKGLTIQHLLFLGSIAGLHATEYSTCLNLCMC